MRKQRGSVISISHDDRTNYIGGAPDIVLFVSAQHNITSILRRMGALGFNIITPEASMPVDHALVLGAGDGARDAMQFAAQRGVARLALLNPSAGSLLALPRGLVMPSLLLMDAAATPSQRLMGQLVAWQLRRQNWQSVLRYASSSDTRDTALLEWMTTGRLADQHSRSASFVSFRRRLAIGAVVGAMALSPAAAVAKTASAPSPAPLAHAQSNFDNMFSEGIKLSSAEVKGDGYTVPANRAQADNPPPQKVKEQAKSGAKPAPDGVLVIAPGNVRGDGYRPESLQSTGSKTLVDGNGVKYFVNTNITFNTSSSASAAMSEASFTMAKSVTTSGGGTVSTILHDAFDGYNSLCVDVNTSGTDTCDRSAPGMTMYNNNGPATLDNACAYGGQVLFPTQVISGVEVSRKVYVPDNDGFARWLNIFHNPTASPISIRIATGNNLGSDSNTTIVNASSGLPASAASQWVTTFQDYSGNTSSDPRLGHVLQGPGALVTPIAGVNFLNGDDYPYWWYVLTLAPGETQIIANFVTAQTSKALAASKSADIVSQMATPGSHALTCTTATERAKITNFVPVRPTAIDLAYFAASQECESVVVKWEALREFGTIGYQVYRGTTNTFANASLLNQNLIVANGSGGSYTFVDETAKSGAQYTYWLVETASDGGHKTIASASITAEGCVITP